MATITLNRPAALNALDEPTLLALRPFRSPQEDTEMTLAALQGLHLSARPELWQSYAAGREAILRAVMEGAEAFETYILDTQWGGRRPDGSHAHDRRPDA